jgi:hypothetical protein
MASSAAGAARHQTRRNETKRAGARERRDLPLFSPIIILAALLLIAPCVSPISVISIKNLPSTTTTSSVRNLCSTAGPVLHVSLRGGAGSALSVGAGSVHTLRSLSAEIMFLERDDAAEAMRRFDGQLTEVIKGAGKRRLVVRLLAHYPSVEGGSKSRSSAPKSSETKLLPRVMHTFYQHQSSRNNAAAESRNAEQLEVWRSTWAAAGWVPMVLTLADAQLHPQYDALLARMRLLPLGGNVEYDLFCCELL